MYPATRMSTACLCPVLVGCTGWLLTQVNFYIQSVFKKHITCAKCVQKSMTNHILKQLSKYSIRGISKITVNYSSYI